MTDYLHILTGRTKQAGLGHEIYKQLPSFHGYDTALGAAAGAGAGALYDTLTPQDEADKHHMLRHVATGAAIGAPALNLAGDRARRYLSNLPDLYSYDPSRLFKSMQRSGLKGAWKGAVLDKPIQSVLTPRTPDLEMRRELLRRDLGVHTVDPQHDFFAASGTAVNGNPRVIINPHWTDQHSKLTSPTPDADWADLAGGAPQGARNLSDVLGHFARKPVPDKPMTSDVSDTWDFDIHPDEWRDDKRYVREALRDPRSLFRPTAVTASGGNTPNRTPAGRLLSSGLRVLLNEALLRKPVTYQQRLHYGNYGPDKVVPD